MSSTSQPTDFSDLYTDLLNRTRSDTGGAATIVQAKRYVNIGLEDMHIGFREKFPWAERSAELITHAEYTTGTVAATQGSTTITGTSTAWDTNDAFSVKNMRAGGKIVIAGGVEVYEIASIGSDTAAVLASDYVKATETAAEYVYFEDEYALDADFSRPISQISFDINDEIPLIGRREFERRYPRNKTPGKPRVATILDLAFSGDTTPVRKVRFHQPPDSFEKIDYSFITNKLVVSSSGTEKTSLSSDDDEPIVPLRYRHVILWHALKHWYRRKDDDRADKYGEDYTDLMLRISGDIEIGASRPQFRPRTSAYTAKARRPWGGSGRRYTTGDAFDEMRS